MTLSKPEQRLSAEDCLQHNWFAKDRAQLQNLLVLNKQVNNFRQANSYCSYKSNNNIDAPSFFMAPNYYQCLELMSA